MIIVGNGHPSADTISLLQCLLEQCTTPKHIKERCDTNDCPRCVYDVYAKELEAPYREEKADGKNFPMLDGERQIPWALGVAIWETLYSKLYPNEQTAARIAERGGFGWDEVQQMAAKAVQRGFLVGRR